MAPGRGRLPNLENLLNKSPQQLVTTLNRFGLAPNTDTLLRSADKALERLDKILVSGRTPDAETWKLIGKQVEQEMGKFLRQSTKDAIRTHRTARAEATGSKLFIWIAVEAGAHSCPSCKKRHGKVKTMVQWKNLGLPGDEVLICNGECLCRITPAE